jgi:hypothetical protein
MSEVGLRLLYWCNLGDVVLQIGAVVLCTGRKECA